MLPARRGGQLGIKITFPFFDQSHVLSLFRLFLSLVSLRTVVPQFRVLPRSSCTPLHIHLAFPLYLVSSRTSLVCDLDAGRKDCGREKWKEVMLQAGE